MITPIQLKEALELQTERGGLLGDLLTAEFGVSQVEVSQAIAEQLADLEAGSGADPSPATGRQLMSCRTIPRTARRECGLGTRSWSSGSSILPPQI